MKRLALLLCLVAALALGVTGTIHAETVDFYLSPASQTVKDGDTFNIAVNFMADTPQPYAVNVHLSYPPDQLQLMGTVSYAGSEYELGSPEDIKDGDISFTRGTTKAVSGDTLVATLAFKGRTGHADIKFVTADTYAAVDGMRIDGSTKDTVVHIDASAAATPNTVNHDHMDHVETATDVNVDASARNNLLAVLGGIAIAAALIIWGLKRLQAHNQSLAEIARKVASKPASKTKKEKA